RRRRAGGDLRVAPAAVRGRAGDRRRVVGHRRGARPVRHDRDVLPGPADLDRALLRALGGGPRARGHAPGGGVTELPAASPAAAAGGGDAGRPAAGRAEWLPTALVFAALVAAVVVAVAVTPNFLTVDNVRAILRNASIVGIVAV